MLFDIRHTTTFNYSGPAWCEPLIIRLRPREDASQTLHQHSLTISPEPAGLAQWLDIDGNPVSCAWFEGARHRLEIHASSLVETHVTNPYDFLLFTAARQIPPTYSQADRALAAHFAQPVHRSLSINTFVAEVLAAAEGETLKFLSDLAARIHDRCRTVERPSGDPWPAEATLEQRQGACRDLAVLFNESCRTIGIPARFVSGYVYSPEADQQQHLHAWSEVYMPGGGWRGFDPSMGIATSDAHVPLAASRLPAGAAPTEGTFRGNRVESRLSAIVDVRPATARIEPARALNLSAGMRMSTREA